MKFIPMNPAVISNYHGCGAAVALLNEDLTEVKALRYVDVSKSRTADGDLQAIKLAIAELQAISTEDGDRVIGGDASGWEFCFHYSKEERKRLGIKHPWF